MNLSPAAPDTPIRTPQLRSSAKSLQLTPIWEEVVKNNRLPPDVNQDLIFKEISVRLEDLEWPVRQHAFRVLYDIIPIISKERLDERITQNNILAKLVVNLGHPAPGIRKVASETLQKYFKRTLQSEKMLENFLQYGVREKDLVSDDQAGILRENITLGTVVALVDVLQPFVSPENGGYSLSQSFLTEIVEALLVQTRKPVYRAKCLETLRKIREMVGETRFSRTLDGLPDREDLLHLMNESHRSENSSFGMLASEDSFDLSPPEGEAENGHLNRHSSSEELSDGSDTDTYTKEPAPTLDGYTVYNVGRAEVSASMPPSFVPVDHSEDFLPSAETKGDDAPSSPRVVLEAEIQFAKTKAITMKVMEDNEGQTDGQKRFTMADGDLVMKVLHDSEEIAEEEKTRTPRRVRFGGEVIKLRTPDSDTADITIEIHEAEGGTTGEEPITTIAPPVTATEPESKSHIPLPLVPVTKAASRDPSPSRRPEPPGEVSPPPKNGSFDSAPSLSGSEGDASDKCSDDDDDKAWKWGEMRLVEENILKDLRNKENWKIQYQALEQLKIVLINPKTIEELEKSKHENLHSLFHCLLHDLPQSNSQQVTTLALSIVSQLIETLPKELILVDVQEIVRGLCNYVGGCKNLNLKIEAIQSLKTLFGILEPSAVIDVLVGEHCLFSSSSKLRENSLLAIMYATMTFPSDLFDMDEILEKVTTSAADMRRRVRHASLEAIAILSQFCSSRTLADNVARVAESLPTPAARAQFIAGVQARLSRRLLPSVSTEGLVLYALQIPASRRFGNMGNPMGADVDWILSGTGSVSTGSAKSKTQLIAAQRLEIRPPASASPSKWTQQHRPRRLQSKLGPGENPWKVQKHRTESAMANNVSAQETNRHLDGDHISNGFLALTDAENSFRPEEITWALVPVSALRKPFVRICPAKESQQMLLCRVVGYRPFVFANFKDEAPLGRERSTSLWGESLGEATTNYLSPPFGALRPMYLKLQPTREHLILARSSDDVRSAHFHGQRKNLEDFTEIRLLTPTILRERRSSDNHYQNKKFHSTDLKDTPTRIPVLCPTTTKNVRGPSRPTLLQGHDRKTSDPEISSPGSQKLSSIPNGFSGAPAFLPNIRAGQRDAAYDQQKSPTSRNLEEVDEGKLQDTMAQLSGLLTASKGVGKSGGRDFYSAKPQSEAPFTANENTDADMFEPRAQNKLFDRSYIKSRDSLPSTVASAPPVISADSRDHVPSASSSNSTDFGTPSGSDLRVRRLSNASGALTDSNGLPYGNYATYNPKLKGKKISLGKNSQNKVGINGNPFPNNLKPFERPKEGLETCFNQLESQQWEVNMLGLTSLVRLLRHHPAIVLAQLHPVIVALGRQVRNLRSQVARVACQASAEMFLALRRNVEPDLEELSGPLFHRSADTNRFIRADCNHALDNMVDSVGHAKAVSVIISKGTTHQNATVRAVAARLLLRLSEKAGAEKLLSIPKEARDKMLQAGANLLMEGKLETRAFAKQVFRVWSSHSSFSNLILEAVEPNVMRHISKTLISLKS